MSIFVTLQKSNLKNSHRKLKTKITIKSKLLIVIKTIKYI